MLGVGVGVSGCTVRVCTSTCLHMGELWIHPLVVDALAVPYTAAPLAFCSVRLDP